MTDDANIEDGPRRKTAPPCYITTLPSPCAGWWERARQTLSVKEFHRLVADVATGQRVIPPLFHERVEVPE